MPLWKIAVFFEQLLFPVLLPSSLRHPFVLLPSAAVRYRQFFFFSGRASSLRVAPDCQQLPGGLSNVPHRENAQKRFPSVGSFVKKENSRKDSSKNGGTRNGLCHTPAGAAHCASRRAAGSLSDPRAVRLNGSSGRRSETP